MHIRTACAQQCARHEHGVCTACTLHVHVQGALAARALRAWQVVMHGNDLCVADIPGILVFAVNHRRERVPLNAQIMIPHTLLQVNPNLSLIHI